MEYSKKAAISQNKKKFNIITVSAVGAVCLVGILLAVYSLYNASYLYAALYFIAVLLGLGYVIIKINSIIPLYIAADGRNVYIQNWNNGAFAYNINFKPSFLADFIPAKVVKYEIPIEKIEKIYVGSKNYLARNLENTDFAERAGRLERARRSDKNAIRRMDFICITDNENKVYFMPVSDIDTKALAEIVNYVHRKNPEAEIKCNLREIRARLTIG